MKKKYKPYSKKTGKFKSKYEQVVFDKLNKPSVVVEYEPEKLDYNLPKKYIPDFVMTTPSGKKIYIEAKGWFRWEDQLKMRAVKESNPDLDIRLVFAYDSKLSAKAGMTNSDWCNKYGFKYAIGEIPRSWFK